MSLGISPEAPIEDQPDTLLSSKWRLAGLMKFISEMSGRSQSRKTLSERQGPRRASCRETTDTEGAAAAGRQARPI